MSKQVKQTPSKRDTRTALTISGGAALTLGVALSPSLDAATFTVSNLNDAGAGSLRQAIIDANTAAGADVVAFQAGLTGTITLSSGQLYIVDSLDIQGPGPANISVNGNNASRVFYLYNGSATIDVTISGLTITDGNASIGSGVVDFDENLTLDNVVISNNTATGDGGGLWADGFNMTLTITNSTITGNTAGSDGGGVYVEDTGGPLLIQNSVISNNSAADDGGGIYFYDPDDSTTISDCTISGNTAADLGGGIYLYDTDGGSHVIRRTTISGNSASAGGGIFLYGPDDPFLVESSTISGNQATAGSGGGIHLYSLYGGFDLRHTTVAGNSATGSGGGVFTLSGPTPVDHSIVGDNSAATEDDLGTAGDGNFDVSFSLVESPGTANINDNGGNIFNQDPQLGPLANNGGPTATHLPASASPVVNAGDPAFAPPPAVDQRGLARVVGGTIDMGAVEINPGIVQFTITAVAVNETDLTLTLTVTRTGGTDGAISVNYAATPGTAVTPGDYTLAAGTLNWANGDAANKTFNITIVNDTVAEPAETFTVSLSSPVGTTVGANSTVTVTINPSLGPAQAEPIPTLGWWAKLAMMLGTAFAGVWALGRRFFAIGLVTLLTATGVAGNVSASAPSSSKGKNAKVTQITSVSAGASSTTAKITIQLGDGTVLNVSPNDLKVSDHRTTGTGKAVKHGRHKGNSLDGISPGQPAIVKVKTDDDSNVQRVRIKLYDSIEKANEGLAGND
ncbi:MAG: right-handed parallel beta-helix repeat-containing protein [Acidobacteria bacterium]|nr:right-handed parallel beta-helix repeat-containing protein [Acidobacteriota bacterium]